MKIYYSSKFAKEYKKLPLKIKILAEKMEKIFRKNPLDPRLKTHKLTGRLKEFHAIKLIHETELQLKVEYKGESVGNYRPDIIVEGKIILELKAVNFIPKTFEDQIIHYLKTTGFKLGLLVNFGSSRLYIKRFVWSRNQ